MSARGIQRERQVRAWYADRDWLAFRAPASLGCADVIAMRDAYADALRTVGDVPRRAVVELVEVKSTAAGPYHGFGPADRERLSDAARMAGARALLAWWPPRGKLRFIPEDEWPAARARLRALPVSPLDNPEQGGAQARTCGEE